MNTLLLLPVFVFQFVLLFSFIPARVTCHFIQYNYLCIYFHWIDWRLLVWDLLSRVPETRSQAVTKIAKPTVGYCLTADW